MDFFPHGFLATVYVVRALSPEVYAEVAEAADQSDATPGELLILPTRMAASTAPTAFVGVSSLAESSIGLVVAMSGADLAAELRFAASELGDHSGELEAELFRQVLELSGRLQRLGGEPAIVRLVEEGAVYLDSASGARLQVSPSA